MKYLANALRFCKNNNRDFIFLTGDAQPVSAQGEYILADKILKMCEKLNIDSPNSFYVLRGGGDESKKQWFMRIAGLDESKFLQSNGSDGTDYFNNETLLGQMFPFSPLGYVNPNNFSEILCSLQY